MSPMLLTAPAPGPEPLGGVAGWAVRVMETLGGPGAALIVGLENLLPPIPSELVLPLAGFSAAQGVFSFAAALFWTTLGSVVGAVVLYAAGMLLGRERARALMVRLPLVKARDVDRSEQWFVRHGAAAVFLGRMVPMVRCFVSVPAGIERMGLAWFLVLTTAGSLIWNSVFVTAGYLLGQNWHIVERYTAILQVIVVAAVVLAIVLFVAARLRRTGSDASSDEAGVDDADNPGTMRG